MQQKNAQDVQDIGYIDYAVLKVVKQHSGAWKKKIHSYISMDIDEFPFVESVAEQTIGRHIDNLVREELIKPVIVSPESVKRKYMTGYELTEKGEQTRRAKQQQILKEKVLHAAHVFSSPDDEPICKSIQVKKSALVNLLIDEFDIKGKRVEEIMNTTTICDLVAILAMYYFRQSMREMTGQLSEEHMSSIKKLVEETPALRNEFVDPCAITVVHSAVQDEK